jgi:hypothetical protein
VSCIHPDGPFAGRSIMDLEALRVQAEDEIDRTRASNPDSPSILALTEHLGTITTEIARMA